MLVSPMCSDEELMAAYVGGDEQAFAELFRRYAPWMLRLLVRGLPSREEANDLLQQTFLHVHRARADFDTGRRVRPWVVAIALNVKREHLRRLQRRGEFQLDESEHREPAATTGDPERSSEAARVRRALYRLSDAQREVLELHWFAGLPFSEIADVVGAKHSAVKVRAHRAYRELRRLLGAPNDVTAGREST
jgi:RNA polymerase sigma-70 factor (ECF subfamily)